MIAPAKLLHVKMTNDSIISGIVAHNKSTADTIKPLYSIYLLFIDELLSTWYASQHIWCLSQDRINWEGCVRKGILRKNNGDGRGGCIN